MEVKGLQHCGLVVQDLDKSRWFYVTVLGMEEVSRPKSFTFVGSWFRSGESELHLITAKDTTAPPGFADPGKGELTGLATHFALEVTDLHALKAHLEQHNVDIVSDILARGDGAEQLYVHDPDGYLIEFFEWTGVGKKDAPERAAVRG